MAKQLSKIPRRIQAATQPVLAENVELHLKVLKDGSKGLDEAERSLRARMMELTAEANDLGYALQEAEKELEATRLNLNAALTATKTEYTRVTDALKADLVRSREDESRTNKTLAALTTDHRDLKAALETLKATHQATLATLSIKQETLRKVQAQLA